mgnify:CR=1 FL=1
MKKNYVKFITFFFRFLQISLVQTKNITENLCTGVQNEQQNVLNISSTFCNNFFFFNDEL